MFEQIDTKALQPKTQDEIAKRFQDRRDDDFLGHETKEYIWHMRLEDIRPYIKDDVTDEEIADYISKPTVKGLLEKIQDYIPYAWSKAKDCRDISALRSLRHYIAWTWMIGDDKFSEYIEHELDDNYEFYGKNILIEICKRYGMDSSKWDDGIRVNSEEELWETKR